MKVIRVNNQVEGGKKAFELLKAEMENGIKTLGLATGSTPLSFYNELVNSDLDFSEMTSINLDEYVGLAAENDQSYHHFMQENLFQYKPFKESFLPNGLATDLQAEAKHYDQIIAEHLIDFQILGIGRNGHIGFNEPGTPFDMTTHIVDLTQDTIEANSRFFDSMEEVPKQAISMGIHSIMQSKMVVLMAYGKDKADAINQMINGPISEALPASVLQNHPNVIVIVDEAAASELD
ncbi:glucosamine-6-phosphate deaminase [Streptococcus equinus]|uniref:Glucosamine-6-phosphate deaminase n=1 Tax=Streptococcus equinus ATCC 9812 TaxID=525379 RepID=E8JM95_STREI|nr:glucosamine-6-phosphate deaminase [Streptococcus equinus]EFW89510.1 glucosamine-6-phosphate deaminase [Streptococcus equinus ATCC 9812]SUN56514.1 glucosamine-6-phosphate deaminase NagB [Streptococcus equinus]